MIMKLRFLLFSLWVALCIIVSYALFHVSFQVEELDKEIKRLNNDITKKQEMINDLKNEWAFLISPERLHVLSAQHFPDYKALEQHQYINID